MLAITAQQSNSPRSSASESSVEDWRVGKGERDGSMFRVAAKRLPAVVGTGAKMQPTSAGKGTSKTHRPKTPVSGLPDCGYALAAFSTGSRN